MRSDLSKLISLHIKPHRRLRKLHQLCVLNVTWYDNINTQTINTPKPQKMIHFKIFMDVTKKSSLLSLITTRVSNTGSQEIESSLPGFGNITGGRGTTDACRNHTGTGAGRPSLRNDHNQWLTGVKNTEPVIRGIIKGISTVESNDLTEGSTNTYILVKGAGLGSSTGLISKINITTTSDIAIRGFRGNRHSNF